MFWVIAVVAMVLISAAIESDLGKLIAICGVVALGLVVLKWITGWAFLAVLAKACVVIIVIVVIGLLVVNIFGA